MRNKESMQHKKRSYSDELKSEAVKMVNEQGLSQEETGRRLSIPSGTIANWMAASKSGTRRSRPGDPSVAELAAENQRLRKELHEARMEREILKSSRVLRQGIAARYAFMTRQRHIYPVKLMARVVRVAHALAFGAICE
jgi:transposase-like protein